MQKAKGYNGQMTQKECKRVDRPDLHHVQEMEWAVNAKMESQCGRRLREFGVKTAEKEKARGQR